MKRPIIVEGYEYTPNELIGEFGDIDTTTFMTKEDFFNCVRLTTRYTCEFCNAVAVFKDEKCLCVSDAKQKTK